jgi:1-acyl-sn-glycerol-3-phosphate acyltransferase
MTADAPPHDAPPQIRRHHTGHLLSRLRSYLVLDPLIFAYTGVFGAGSLLTSFFDRNGAKQHAFARAWSKMILETAMSPVEVVGAENWPPSAAVVAPNHISAMDIPVLYTQLPFQFRIVANKELFNYPFLGWHLRRSGQIPIDRTTPKTTIKTLSTAVEDLKKGISVVIFPEGGRSRTGQIQPFMNGAFYLAVKAQAPVLPVAIVGTYEMLPMDTFHIMPRPLKLVIGKAVPTIGFTLRDLDSLAAQVKAEIADLYYAHSEVPRPIETPLAASSESTKL